MNFLEKTMVKKVAGVEESQFNISEESIDSFVQSLKNN